MDRDSDQESGFEERLIEDEERNDIRYYTTQLLLSIQGLGKMTTIGEIEVYAKGEKAEGFLKHLCQQCKKDIPEKPTARMYLAKYHVMKRDLMNLLTCYPQDKVLSYYVVILMEQLTNTQKSGIQFNTPLAAQMLDALQEYKLCFMKPLVLRTLVLHFADCTQIEAECRTKVHNDMIELIVLLFKNLLSIPDIPETKMGLESGKEMKRNLQRNFIHGLNKENVLSAFIYISQDFSSSLMKRLALPLVEIFYYAFTPFDPEWLLRNDEEEREIIIKQAQQYKLQKQQSLGQVPTRHSRFAGLFITKRDLSTSGQISSVPFHQHQVNKLANQRKQPQVRALIQKHQNIFLKPLTINLYDPEQEKSFKEDLKYSTIDFLMHCFSKLVDQAFIDMNQEIVETDDKVHYFVLIAYFLKFVRLYCKQQEKPEGELSQVYVSISAALQITQFTFIYENLIHESLQMKKKNFNYRNYFAVVNVLLEFLLIVRELSLSIHVTDRRNSQILLETIATKDIAKAIQIGYGYCQNGLFDDQMLITLVKFTALFYDLLETHSRGKAWSIRTNKLLKKKMKKDKKIREKKQQEEQEDRDFIEQEPDIEQEAENEEEDSETDDDEPIYKERKCNFQSEFAIVVDYKVLEKYFYLIKDEKLLNNSSELNIAIYKYFKRVVDALKADWIFFQVDFLYIINSILNNKQVTYRSEFTNIVQLFRRIGISFIQLLKVNRLLSVEILFRFPSAQIKDSILRNYADVVAEDEETHVPQLEAKVIWTQKEDKILIENYEKYKDCEEPEEQLSLLLSQQGFTMKSPQEVRKRIKKFRLKEGNEKAIEKYQQLYEVISMKKVEIMAKSVKSLLQEVGEDNINCYFDHLFSTLRTYVEYRGHECIEMPIPPMDKLQFEYFEKTSVQAILIGLDIKPPSVGEIYWRLQTHTFLPEIDEMRKQLTKYIEKAKKIDDQEVLEEYQPLRISTQKKERPSEQKELNQEEEAQIYEKYMEQREAQPEDEYDDIFD